MEVNNDLFFNVIKSKIYFIILVVYWIFFYLVRIVKNSVEFFVKKFYKFMKVSIKLIR